MKDYNCHNAAGEVQTMTTYAMVAGAKRPVKVGQRSYCGDFVFEGDSHLPPRGVRGRHNNGFKKMAEMLAIKWKMANFAVIYRNQPVSRPHDSGPAHGFSTSKKPKSTN